MRKSLLIIVLLLLCINIAYAAELHGTIYNSQLELQKDVIVEINTEPKQSIVSKDGAYSFNVPEGEYALKAAHYYGSEIDLKAEESVSVSADGSYTLDIILFDALDEEEMLEDFDFASGLEENGSVWYLGVAFLAVLFIAIILALHFAGKKVKKVQQHIEDAMRLGKNPDKDLEKIIQIIKSEGGRTTQLEIRKHIPLSEAKISLMIAELEHKGIVKKIKKGRGNIIILSK
ncbi:MAG: hypothetical protein KJ955_00710 [Nanoarchaeota archaeon]|nr:hypothetical protein [Nanoarchaeota archaeon]